MNNYNSLDEELDDRYDEEKVWFDHDDDNDFEDYDPDWIEKLCCTCGAYLGFGTDRIQVADCVCA